jgi:hypothetical protein
MTYQERDKHIIDYDMYQLEGIAPYPGNGMFRGPKTKTLDYIAVIGSAHSFGCFTHKPYPIILKELLGIEVLNLGYGGASPTFFTSNKKLIEYINNSKLVILQVLSGRSCSNDYFSILYHGMEGLCTFTNEIMTAEEFYSYIINERPLLIREIIAKTQSTYLKEMSLLISLIHKPIILFWFSQRSPVFNQKYELPLWKLWGKFPQFVNLSMIENLSNKVHTYVQCISSKGMPQILYDKFGEPTSVSHSYSRLKKETRVEFTNNYYPSPEMHIDAAKSLLEPVIQLL